MKKILSVLLCLAMIFSLAACGSKTEPAPAAPAESSSAAAPAAPAEQIVLKISHQNASTHPIQLGFLEFKTKLEELSGGTMTADIYDSAVLGNDTSNLQQVVAGSLDAAMIMGVSIWQGYDERACAEELPFLFADYDQAYAAWDGEFGQFIIDNVIEPQGGHVVDFWDNGFRLFTNNIRPIYKPADMAGIKFRTAEVPLRLMMFDELGSSAIVLAFSELYSAMQQGTVDGQENPYSNIVASCFYEVQKYLSVSRHIYNTSCFIFSDNCWNSLTDEQKGWVEEASKVGKEYCRKVNVENEEAYKQTCLDGGMEINEVDHEAFVEAVQPVWDYFRAQYGDELINIAQKYTK